MTLAQHFLENRKSQPQRDMWPLTRLSAPPPGFDPRKGDVVAEQFVFQEDLTELRTDFMKSGQLSLDTLLTTVHLPSRCCWIEWTSLRHEGKPLKIGGLFEVDDETLDLSIKQSNLYRLLEDQKPTGRIAVGMIGALRDGYFPAHFLYGGGMDALPFPNGSAPYPIDLTFCSQGNVNHEEMQSTFSHFVVDALFGFFLLSYPKVVIKQKVDHAPALQKARKKKNKPELVTYSKVTLTIGKPSVRRHSADHIPDENTDEAKGPKRKWHMVDFHWKTIKKNGEPKAIFINSYERGDPSLGISIKKKNIRVDDSLKVQK